MRPHLYLDIETIPCQDPAHREALAVQPEFQVPDSIGEIKAAGNLKDPEKIQADIAAKTAKAEADLVERRAGVGAAIDKAWRKTSLDGTFGHVALVSWGYVGEDISTEACLIRDGETYRLPVSFDETIAAEKAALTSFFAAIEDEARSHGCAPVLVAHHAPFDLRFLIQRAVVHGIKLPHWWPRDPKPLVTGRPRHLGRLGRSRGHQARHPVPGARPARQGQHRRRRLLGRVVGRPTGGLHRLQCGRRRAPARDRGPPGGLDGRLDRCVNRADKGAIHVNFRIDVTRFLPC